MPVTNYDVIEHIDVLDFITRVFDMCRLCGGICERDHYSGA